MKLYLLIIGIAGALTGGFISYNAVNQTVENTDNLGAFSDPSISLQLASSPQNGYILSTDGTNNSWIANGGGSSLHTDATTYIYPTGGKYHSAPFYVATSTVASSSFPYASTTGISGTNATFTSFIGALIGNANTATSLFANGANCSAGNAPLGVDASGAVESCFDVWTEAENTSAGYYSISSDTYLFNNADDSTTGRLTVAGLTSSAQIFASTTIHAQANASNLVARLFENTGGEYFDMQVDANGDLLFVADDTNTILSLGDASGNVGIGFNLVDLNDTDTYFDFATADNNVGYVVGGIEFWDMTETTQDILTFNANANDIDMVINSATQAVLTLNAGTDIISLLGAWDFGSATLEIPNGTAPTVDAAGEIAYDTSDNQLIVGASAHVVPTQNVKIWSATIGSTTPAFISGGLLKVPTMLDGYTMTAIRCSVQDGTSKVIAVEDESANSTEDITCATSVTSDDGSITNATVTAGEEMYIDFGATTGSVNNVSISVFGNWSRE